MNRVELVGNLVLPFEVRRECDVSPTIARAVVAVARADVVLWGIDMVEVLAGAGHV